MSIERGRAYFRQFGMEDRVIEFTVSSATVELAAKALGVEGARIAKTLSFKKPEGGALLILAAGDARIDNHKFKEKFRFKAKMLTPEEVLELVGHPVGGVCPFGINEGVDVYLDDSLKRFETVYPAVGSGASAIELNMDELWKYSNALEWIDVCKLPERYKNRRPAGRRFIHASIYSSSVRLCASMSSRAASSVSPASSFLSASVIALKSMWYSLSKSGISPASRTCFDV